MSDEVVLEEMTLVCKDISLTGLDTWSACRAGYMVRFVREARFVTQLMSTWATLEIPRQACVIYI